MYFSSYSKHGGGRGGDDDFDVLFALETSICFFGLLAFSLGIGISFGSVDRGVSHHLHLRRQRAILTLTVTCPHHPDPALDVQSGYRRLPLLSLTSTG